MAAIYTLGEREAGMAMPLVEPIPPTTVARALMACRTISYLQLDSVKQAREFAGLSRVAMAVPARRVICDDSLDALPHLCDAIIEDISTLTC